MASRSNLKLSEVIRQRAAHVILFELKDPRMGFVTITRVKLSPDFTACTIFWSVYGGGSERSKTAHALDHARIFIQRRVAAGLRLRSAPELSFEFDESVEGAIRMTETLKKLRSERPDPVPDAETGEPGAGAPLEGDAVPSEAPSDATPSEEPAPEEPTDDEPPSAR